MSEKDKSLCQTSQYLVNVVVTSAGFSLPSECSPILEVSLSFSLLEHSSRDFPSFLDLFLFIKQNSPGDKSWDY